MVSMLQRMLLRDLRRLFGQVAAVALVVMCAVAVFVTMRGVHDMLVEARDNFYRDYRFADVFATARRAPEALAERLTEIPGVAAVQTAVEFTVTLDVPGLAEPASAQLVSLPSGPDALNRLHLRRGRIPEPGSDREVLVSEAFARANHLEPGSTLSAIINSRWTRLVVSGIVISPEYIFVVRGANGLPDDARFGILWMNRAALARAADMQGAFNRMSLELASGASLPTVLTAVDRLLARYGGVLAHGREDQLSHKVISDEISQTRVHALVVSAIFLTVAAFIEHIVLLRLVARQRVQIAVLKAFGFSNRRLALHYLLLAQAPVVLGATAGLPLAWLLGSQLAVIYRQFFHFPYLDWVFSIEAMGIAVAITSAAALLGAFNAVAAVVELPPAQALSGEAVTPFRGDWLAGARPVAWLGTPSRMVLRNLGRRPWKAFFAAVGVALAIAILVVGRFGVDALDRVMEIEFQRSQKADVSVDLSQPRGRDASHALARLPGVWAVESFRAVPVVLVFEHRRRLTQILAFDPQSRLRSVVSVDGQPVVVPEEGLMLSAKLAKNLAVRPGDVISVRVLERDLVLEGVPVVAVVDDLVGSQGYMSLASLNRLLKNDAGQMSGAWLAVDPAAAQLLYDTLKALPMVQSPNIKSAAVSNFRDVLARGMRVQTLANIFFACIIAFGVVYNSTSIAAEERAHELATLRVLGFTQREVSAVLLGEQALIVLLATPLGLWLGTLITGWVVRALEAQETFRLPLSISPHTYAFASAWVWVAAAVSAALVWKDLQKLDLVAVLKSRD